MTCVINDYLFDYWSTNNIIDCGEVRKKSIITKKVKKPLNNDTQIPKKITTYTYEIYPKDNKLIYKDKKYNETFENKTNTRYRNFNDANQINDYTNDIYKHNTSVTRDSHNKLYDKNITNERKILY